MRMNRRSETKPGIQIARIADLPAISRMADFIWRRHFPGIITAEQIDYMLGRMYDPAAMRDEVRTQGIVYGFVRLGRRRVGYFAYGPAEDPREMKLHKLYVHPDCRGRGYGSFVIRHLIGLCRRRRLRFLILAVNKRNKLAIDVYRKNGFRVRASVRKDIGDGFVMNDYIMEKAVTRRAASRRRRGSPAETARAKTTHSGRVSGPPRRRIR